jgi:hypothetical protein
MHIRKQLIRQASMRSVSSLIILASFFSAQTVQADATIRYRTDVKPGASVPTATAQQMKLPVPQTSVIQIKGDKGYSTASFGASLMEFTKQEITVLDAQDKLFATVSMKDYLGELRAAMPAIPALPPGAKKFIDSIKANVSSQKTGKTDVLLGVQVEETEATVTLDAPVPAELLPLLPPGTFQPDQPVTLLKFVMHLWKTAPGEISRVPALAELMTYRNSSVQFLNPGAAYQQLLGSVPGIGQNLAPLFESFSSDDAVLLRSHLEVYAPVLGQIVPLLQAQGKQPPGGLDANTPLTEIDMVATEISSAPIDDSVFEVPGGYHATPLPDLLKSMMPHPGSAALPAANR